MPGSVRMSSPSHTCVVHRVSYFFGARRPSIAQTQPARHIRSSVRGSCLCRLWRLERSACRLQSYARPTYTPSLLARTLW
jgi:hypothetical protein